MKTCLVHLASGIGNIVLATPLLLALDELEYAVEVCLDADYEQTADLIQPWSVVRAVHIGNVVGLFARKFDAIVPAIPPFYWPRFASAYRIASRVVARPPDRLFATDEQAYYVAFARALGYAGDRRPYRLPIGPREDETRVGLQTLALAPGCKTGTMAAKRWPWFSELADRFADVVVVGTGDDMRRHDGTPLLFSSHVRSFVDRITLRETAELLASAGAVVANDSGLAHVSAAVGTLTLMLFGPTSHTCLGEMPPNATVLRMGLPCEPCWTRAPLDACQRRVDCLSTLNADVVERAVRSMLGLTAREERAS